MPEFIHRSVMVSEVLDALRPRSGMRVIDGTVGGGGHAEAILEASSPDGRLYGFDRDEQALEAAEARLSRFAGRFELRQANFADLASYVEPKSYEAVLLDLGVSSPQLDRPERGFSFQADGPLDMRMQGRQPVCAADLVRDLSEAELAKIFWEFGEEPQARRIARAIVQDRTTRPFRTTRELAQLIERICPRSGKRHPATRVFQALRVATNDELNSLRKGLAAAYQALASGGILAVITFNSIEDRIVKGFGRDKTRDYTAHGDMDVPELRTPKAPEMKWISRKAIQPSEQEVRENPRARSAQLRVLQKL